MAIKYIKWPENMYIKRPLNTQYIHKIYQHLSLQDTPKFTQIGIIGLKIYHLAALFGIGLSIQLSHLKALGTKITKFLSCARITPR
jgi:hypothetical protein